MPAFNSEQQEIENFSFLNMFRVNPLHKKNDSVGVSSGSSQLIVFLHRGASLWVPYHSHHVAETGSVVGQWQEVTLQANVS